MNINPFENTEQQIKAHLKNVLPEDVYDKWIDNFVFESIGAKRIVIGYYGQAPLKEFNENYRENVWLQICAAIGSTKKLKIHKRKNKASKLDAIKANKNVRAAKWFGLSVAAAAVILAVAVMGGSYIVNRNFRETFYSVGSLKVNNNVRVIQISDLHSCKFGKDNSKLTSRIEKLNPDLIVLTGDCLDAEAASTEPVVNVCSQLAKTAPTYYIYGNNEVERFYDTPLTQEALDEKFGFNDDNRDPSRLLKNKDDFEKELEKNGVKVLKNKKDTITAGATEVDIYGVLTSNPSSFWSYSGESFDDYIYNNTNNLKITAVHEPFIFEEYETSSWGDLLVCGHTHGGVVKIPVLGAMYTHEGGLFPEKKGFYVYGRYNAEGSPLIVSSGLSNRNILRINNQPELVIIDINKF